MRIPFSIAIPACCLAVLLTWWIGTRRLDFLTPPTEARLEEIRVGTLAALSSSIKKDDAIAVRVAPPAASPPPRESHVEIFTNDIGDLSPPKKLDTYSDRAPEGSKMLLAFADALVKQGAFQRALLAYERVLDLSESTPDQIQLAISSIQRIKPTLIFWNMDRAAALPVIIHIGTGEKFSKILPELLEPIIADLNTAASGLANFTYEISIGRSVQNAPAPTPIGVWITGGGGNSPSTDVLAFATEDPTGLRDDLLKTVFNLVRSHLIKNTSYSPAPEIIDQPLPALQSHISRLLWQEFATLLNPPPKAGN